jgi:hypothetical protein
MGPSKVAGQFHALLVVSPPDSGMSMESTGFLFLSAP